MSMTAGPPPHGSRPASAGSRHRLMAGALFVVVLLAPGCGKPANRGGPPAATEVTVVTLAPERVVLTTELPGRTAPFLVAEVRPQVSGLLKERRFEEGADVKSGDLLYQIDRAPYQAALEQAEGALAAAEAALPAVRARAERVRALVAEGIVGLQDGDDAESALLQAEATVVARRAAVESARINLGYTPIRAPIAGRTGRSSVTVGALLIAYQQVALVTIQQLDPIYVDVMQSSSEVLRLRRALSSGALMLNGESARRVRLLLEDGTPYALAGTLAFQETTVNPTTGSVTLRMVFPNPDHVLLPGMFVRAIVEEGVDEEAILAPQEGVSRNPRGDAIALVVGAGDKAEERRLVLGRALGNRWLVASGLGPGDRLIVDSLQRIRPGDAVTPVAAAPVAAHPAADPGAASSGAAASGAERR